MGFIKVLATNTGGNKEDEIYLNTDLIAYFQKHTLTRFKIILKEGVSIPGHRAGDLYVDVPNPQWDKLNLIGLIE